MKIKLFELRFFAILIIMTASLMMIVSAGYAQNKAIDGVAAIVGGNIILKSDIEGQYLQSMAQGAKLEEKDLKCRILEELMFQKMLVVQAAIDSVKVTDSQVEDELDKRIRYFVKQLGSKEKLEEYYKKSLYQIKNDFREVIKDMLYAQSVQQKITKDIKVTPGEVKSFYKQIPKDSLPMIGSEVEIGVIAKQPKISSEEKRNIKQKLNDLRDRIVNGEKFSTMAVLYSEDEVTAKQGGEIGTHARGDLIPEFEAFAFNLKPVEVSPVIETSDGFYIIQVIERKGDYINLRQLLLRPKVSETDLYNCKVKLDSILPLITSSKMTFEEASGKYNHDLQAKNNKGLMVNSQTGNSKFAIEELDQNLFFSIDKMKVGDIANPVLYDTEDGRKAYRILYLKTRTDPHRANMKDDYDKIQTAALNQKKNQAIDEWIRSKANSTYIRIMDDFKGCTFKHNWEKSETKK